MLKLKKGKLITLKRENIGYISDNGSFVFFHLGVDLIWLYVMHQTCVDGYVKL
jgi:hypothetical protein